VGDLRSNFTKRSHFFRYDDLVLELLQFSNVTDNVHRAHELACHIKDRRTRREECPAEMRVVKLFNIGLSGGHGLVMRALHIGFGCTMEQLITLFAEDLLGGKTEPFHDCFINSLDDIIAAVEIDHVRHGFENIFELLLSQRHLLVQTCTLNGGCDLVRKTRKELHVLIGNGFPVEVIVYPDHANDLVAGDERDHCIGLRTELLNKHGIGKGLFSYIFHIKGKLFLDRPRQYGILIEGELDTHGKAFQKGVLAHRVLNDLLHDLIQGLLFQRGIFPYLPGLFRRSRSYPHDSLQHVLFIINEKKNGPIESHAIAHGHRSQDHPEKLVKLKRTAHCSRDKEKPRHLLISSDQFLFYPLLFRDIP